MNLPEHPSIFIISLDFELYWGVRDVKSINEYKKNIEGVHTVIPQLLDIFTKYNIEVSWATVGLLFYNNFKELEDNIPASIAKYESPAFSPYEYVRENINNVNESFLKKHFAPDLIRLIANTPGQEIASHTYSHYYSLEKGETVGNFDADLIKNIEVAHTFDIQIKSIVFPRNQINENYFPILKKHGINSFRGTQNSKYHKPDNNKSYNNFIKKAFRYLDTFFNLTNSSASIEYLQTNLLNIPASRFLQSYSGKRLPFLERLKIKRIKNEMTRAANKKHLYHLWWHPHNFGKHIAENMAQLGEILLHYKKLNEEGKMISMNMGNIADECNKK